ncbi:protein of unknown function (plasmid) [Cupriavidus taiwanensis]|uniref:Uncharacterized protein n=1 Tax=Cupriavidus taiwanensis TaxID=164546 RepID=A0A375F804_9BURK|nr:hypothetical protein CBM2637_P250003 [Cupriavidus taiwanensis]SPA54197.1 hypothetical protein CBM2606_P250003 [Cupriavidus taiwanensis]SPD69550.1 protein of unknown function [Cupriavidus taiwanensis]
MRQKNDIEATHASIVHGRFSSKSGRMRGVGMNRPSNAKPKPRRQKGLSLDRRRRCARVRTGSNTQGGGEYAYPAEQPNAGAAGVRLALRYAVLPGQERWAVVRSRRTALADTALERQVRALGEFDE